MGASRPVWAYKAGNGASKTVSSTAGAPAASRARASIQPAAALTSAAATALTLAVMRRWMEYWAPMALCTEWLKAVGDSASPCASSCSIATERASSPQRDANTSGMAGSAAASTSC